MTTGPELQDLARLIRGEPRAAIRRVLQLSCRLLHMDLAFVSVLAPEGRRTVELAVQADGSAVAGAEGQSDPLEQTWCGRVIEDGVLLVDDAADQPRLQALPTTAAFGIVSYAGVPLRAADSTILGTFCAIGHQSHAGLGAQDGGVLLGLAEVVAPLLEALLAGGHDDPVAPPGSELLGVAATVSEATGLDGLTRPLLAALHELTGLGSSYLTVIHLEAGLQEVRYAQNVSPELTIPEGLFTPWEGTLCKRALDEGRPCTSAVPEVWPDSEPAAALGLQVYVSVPIQLPTGEVWGTLCATDTVSSETAPETHLPTMRLFARLIAAEVTREEALARERAETARARRDADTDPLTGCFTRRVIEPWLEENRAALAPEEVLLVGYADIDGFKAVNDRFGHLAGDAVLVDAARRLHAALGPTDLVVRLGGDEFMVGARLPAPMAPVVVQRVRAAMTFETTWQHQQVPVHLSLGSASTGPRGTVDLLALADADMYREKRLPRAVSSARLLPLAGRLQ